MAEPQQQGGQGIDPAVADALKQHLQVATSMAKMGHDAMGAAHKQVVSTAGAHSEKIVGALSDAMQQGGGGGSQTEQAVWTAFPGLDPKVVSGIPDPDKLHELFKADEQKLLQGHQAMEQQWMNQNSQPQGAPESPQPPPQLGAGLGG